MTASALRGLRDAGRRAVARLLNPLDPPVVVLLYHRVGDPDDDPHGLAVSPARFRAQMERLRQRMPVVRLTDPWSRRATPAAAITFDDGYADNRTEALPILESLQVPATFFVTTGNVESGRAFWWDELDARVRLGPRPSRFSLDDPAHGGTWPTATADQRARMGSDLHARMKQVDATRREAWFAQLSSWAGTDAGTTGGRPMTVDELRQLGASPWASVGAHTVTHPRLAALDVAAQRTEIVASRARLEEWLGRPVTLFSFPFGERRDFTAETIALCRDAGFARTASNVPGTWHRWTDLQRLPRHVVRDWTADEFDRRLDGFLLS